MALNLLQEKKTAFINDLFVRVSIELGEMRR